MTREINSGYSELIWEGGKWEKCVRFYSIWLAETWHCYHIQTQVFFVYSVFIPLLKLKIYFEFHSNDAIGANLFFHILKNCFFSIILSYCSHELVVMIYSEISMFGVLSTVSSLCVCCCWLLFFDSNSSFLESTVQLWWSNESGYLLSSSQ